MPQVANRRVRKDSVHVLLLQTCEEEKQKRSGTSATQDENRKLSVIHEVVASDRRESTVSQQAASRLPPQAIEPLTSLQPFIEKIEVVSQGVSLLELKLAGLERLHRSAPRNDQETFVANFLSKQKEHGLIIRELDGLFSLIQHQIESIKRDLQNAGESGVLSINPLIHRKEYSTLTDSFSRVISNYYGAETIFLQWQKNLEERSSVISTLEEASNRENYLEEMGAELNDFENVGKNFRKLLKIFGDFADLVESQADLLDQMNELHQGTEAEPGVSIRSSDELGDKLLLEKKMHKRVGVKWLILFGILGLTIFMVLTTIMLSRGRTCYSDVDKTSVYSCV